MSGSTVARVIKNASIFKVLDVSTCHITLEDSKGLACNAMPAANSLAPVYEKGEYGWFAYVGGDIDESWPKEDWSPAIRIVLQTAESMGCDWVCFDRDGQEYSELEKFDW